MDVTQQDALRIRRVVALERIADALEAITDSLGLVVCGQQGDRPGHVRTSDIDRAKVYGEHLGSKLREGN